ncbi:SusC/RagA family TonB-linked outer membrane protein [Salegentibacter sp. Hel_I_6]|uniref:SusC/RagA family TonB-linked outer membrane protein n=1 Tax=Salegentibacter sp. Hel_I_6 TaxID=1250278 RepID=UPI000561AAEE|nr:SusC/RagA family TonB-linked outer membrane protein [Salegentibacter sp. Hel_I_6]
MKKLLKSRNEYYKVSLFALFFIYSLNVLGQTTEYTFEGTVTDKNTNIPLSGVSVFLENTNRGASTDFDGNYSFTATLEEGDYTLIADYIGFKTQRVQLELGPNNMITTNFELTEDLLNLDEVVITGNVIGTNKRALAINLSSVDADNLTNNASVQVDQALQGKITGALVTQNSGDPAGGISVVLRGASSLGGNQPLYILDGVILNNSSNELVDIGGNSQNRLADLNPEDIARIEVIKGAAASAIYGSRANNGVVQIFTKKGKSGETKFNFNSSIRTSSLRKEIDYNTAPLAWEDPFDRNNLNTVPTERFNLQDEIFETGIGIENYLSISGGNDDTQYYVSASQTDNEGIVKNTDFNRVNFKTNIVQQAFDWLKVTGDFNYSRSTSQDVPNGGINAAYGAITGFLFSDNSINPAPNESGVYPVTSLLVPRTNPAEAVNRFDFGNKTNRFITSFKLDADITENLKASYVFGLDYYNQSATAFLPVNNTSSIGDGFARRSDRNNFQYNSDLNLSYAVDLSDDIESTTIVGGTYQFQETETISIQATGLPPVVQTATSGGILEQGESRIPFTLWGGFVQQTFGYKNKLYVNGALRTDGSSVFAEDQRNQLYAKAGFSYIISEENFWQQSLGETFNTLKFRAAWGQSGGLGALPAFSRFTNFTPGSINGQNSLILGTQLGNIDASPERQSETEIGFDAGLFNGRIGIEFTYYQQEVSDLLLNRELAPSAGFGSRFESVGTLENSGVEIMLRANPIRTDNFNWNVSTTYTSNENEITNVAGQQFALAGSFSTNYVIEGESLGVFRGSFYERDNSGEIVLDDAGYPVRGTNEDGSTAKVIGDPNPDWFGSLINEFSYKNFNFRFQFDAVQGFDVFNWNRRLLDNVIFGGGSNVGEELLGNRPKAYGGAQAGIFEEFVEDGSFVKLREVSLSYTIKDPMKYIDNVRFNLVGRNLISWDNYSGWDPEVNTGGQGNVRGFDFGAVPIPRTYQFGINVSF